MPKVTASPPKRSKVEVDREFSRIAEESTGKLESANPKEEALAQEREAEIRKAVGGMTVEGALRRISGLGLEISKALASLSESLVSESYI